MGTIQRRMATGIVWMVLARLLDRGIGVISTLILARLLVPADFGLVALATTIGGVLDLLGAFSFDLALIQKKDADKRHYDTVWTFSVLFGIFCTGVLIACAIPAAKYYREPRLESVMYVLALTYLVGGFSNVGIVDFRKELRFKDEFVFTLIRRVVTFFVTVGGAIVLRSYWALVTGMLVGRLISVFVSYRMSGYRPHFALSASRELLHFSKWLFFNNTLFFLMHTGPNFLIGRVNGVSGLGIYSVAYEISNLPSSELVAPINRVTFPGLAKLGTQDAIAAAYLKLFGVITLLILPVGIGIAAVAEPLVLALLGSKWIEAIPLIKVLAVYGAIAATQTNNGVTWMAMGRPRDITIVAGAYLAVFIPLLYFLVQQVGVLGAGYAYLFCQIAWVPVGMWNTKRLLPISWKAIISNAWRPCIAAAIMYVSVSSLDLAIGRMSPWFRLFAEAALGAAIYSVAIIALWISARRPRASEATAIDQITQAIYRFSRRGK